MGIMASPHAEWRIEECCVLYFLLCSTNNNFFQINKRGETVDEKIKKLDAELARYKEQIKKTRPGPAQEAVKARAMRVLKQKRM
ncbi:hypothetical protein BHE74_00058286 [Ensete ventricosum]|uniref:Uncharacterized protein n=1 Tax=Ensete ventricosum TaxID=4639 RepID=A0A426YRE8_ENSVE|nr:hypothetical protein B296_00049287 [Ensete ventricosum]RWW36673.1 hypothetical protein BHE74_00058286 [Ensete ventricosum]RZS02360.1 hypothetical protein BHM03_00032406 [Ensete ventricosum]